MRLDGAQLLTPSRLACRDVAVASQGHSRKPADDRRTASAPGFGRRAATRCAIRSRNALGKRRATCFGAGAPRRARSVCDHEGFPRLAHYVPQISLGGVGAESDRRSCIAADSAAVPHARGRRAPRLRGPLTSSSSVCRGGCLRTFLVPHIGDAESGHAAAPACERESGGILGPVGSSKTGRGLGEATRSRAEPRIEDGADRRSAPGDWPERALGHQPGHSARQATEAVERLASAANDARRTLTTAPGPNGSSHLFRLDHRQNMPHLCGWPRRHSATNGSCRSGLPLTATSALAPSVACSASRRWPSRNPRGPDGSLGVRVGGAPFLRPLGGPLSVARAARLPTGEPVPFQSAGTSPSSSGWPQLALERRHTTGYTESGPARRAGCKALSVREQVLGGSATAESGLDGLRAPASALVEPR